MHARAVMMREGDRPRGRGGAEGGWLTWLRRLRRAGAHAASTRARSCATSATRGRCAAASSRLDPEAEAASAYGRAPDGRPRPGREVTPAEPLVLDRGDRAARGRHRHRHQGSIVRNLRERGVRLELLPCALSAEDVLAREPDAVFLANGPGDPAALDYVVGHRARAGRQGAGLGHLPRPPAALPRRRPRDLQAALRPPRRQPPGQGPRDRAGSTSPRRTTASRCWPGRRAHDRQRRAIRWDTDFGSPSCSS